MASTLSPRTPLHPSAARRSAAALASCGAALVAILWCSPLRAQPSGSPEAPTAEIDGDRNAVQLDLGLAVVGLAYERRLGARFAVQLEGQVFGTWFLDPYLRGAGVQVRPTVFLGREPPRGLYVAAYGRLDQVTDDDTDAEGHARSVGGLVGWSFLFGARYNVRVGAGVQVMHYEVELDGVSSSDNRVLPALDLVLGWQF